MLTAKQADRTFAYHMKIYEGETELGELDWSALPTANNSRYRPLVPKEISTPKIQFRGEEFSIEFEYTKIGWHNDIRFLLKKSGEILAEAEIKRGDRWYQGPSITMRVPFPALLRRRSGFLRIRYTLEDQAGLIGAIEEPFWFSWRRQFRLDFKRAMPEEIQIFALFIAANQALR